MKIYIHFSLHTLLEPLDAIARIVLFYLNRATASTRPHEGQRAAFITASHREFILPFLDELDQKKALFDRMILQMATPNPSSSGCNLDSSVLKPSGATLLETFMEAQTSEEQELRLDLAAHGIKDSKAFFSQFTNLHKKLKILEGLSSTAPSEDKRIEFKEEGGEEVQEEAQDAVQIVDGEENENFHEQIEIYSRRASHTEGSWIDRVKNRFSHKRLRDKLELFYDDKHNHMQLTFRDIESLIHAVEGKIYFRKKGSSHCKSSKCIQAFRRSFEKANLTPDLL